MHKTNTLPPELRCGKVKTILIKHNSFIEFIGVCRIFDSTKILFVSAKEFLFEHCNSCAPVTVQRLSRYQSENEMGIGKRSGMKIKFYKCKYFNKNSTYKMYYYSNIYFVCSCIKEEIDFSIIAIVIPRNKSDKYAAECRKSMKFAVESNSIYIHIQLSTYPRGLEFYLDRCNGFFGFFSYIASAVAHTLHGRDARDEIAYHNFHYHYPYNT